MKENYSVARTLNFFFTKVHVLCRRQIRLLSVKFKHITPVLGDFHWLRVPERLRFSILPLRTAV